MTWLLQTNNYNDSDPDFCYAELPPQVAQYYHVTFGYPAKEGTLEMSELRMSNILGGKLVPDVVPGSVSCWVVTRRFGEWVAEHAGLPVVLFPIILKDHRNKPVKKDLVVMNLEGWVDCIDRDRTVDMGGPCCIPRSPRTVEQGPAVETSPAEDFSDEYDCLVKFHVVDALVPETVNIFRPYSFRSSLLWRERTAREALAAGFTGLVFHKEGDELDDIDV